MEEVQRFTRSHWTPQLGKYLLQYDQSVMPTLVIFEFYTDQLVENGRVAKGWPQLTPGV